MEWIEHLFRQHPELAIFLTLAVGFWIGQLKFGKFSLGTVTSVLLVGVLVGQMDITINEPIKSVFFLLFLFAIGYKVGPQFFRGLKKDGLPQVGFAALMCVFCLLVPWGLAMILGYSYGEAAGLLAGSQTISAVIGVATDTINGLNISDADKVANANIIPVAYAVTYIFGTAGSAWVLASIGPRMLGGIDKVRAACKELESKMGETEADEPGFENALRTVVFRAYKIENEWFESGKTVDQLESYLAENKWLLYVERIRRKEGKEIINDITPATLLQKGDEIVLSGRREYAIGENEWVGNEVYDEELLNFPVEVLPVMVSNKHHTHKALCKIARKPFMHGVSVRRIKRAGVDIPVMAKTIIDSGDTLELTGTKKEVEIAAKELGYADRPSYSTDMMYVGIGILIGGIFGALTIHLGGVPLSLSTSGGALIAGLFFGWIRSKRPTFGHIPEASLWVLNNVGLNVFIAVVGITAGPSFVDGLKEVGPSLFIAGIVATTLPLIIGILLGKYLFKFHPAYVLGCTAGARTTTAALGAIQDAVQSDTPALGYTITYAVGNTLLIIWGVAIVLLM